MLSPNSSPNIEKEVTVMAEDKEVKGKQTWLPEEFDFSAPFGDEV